MNSRNSKICVECLLLEELQKENLDIIKETEDLIEIKRKNVYTVNSNEAQLIKVIKINVMAQHIFDDEWNIQLLISKHSFTKILSVIVFAFLIVLYEF